MRRFLYILLLIESLFYSDMLCLGKPKHDRGIGMVIVPEIAYGRDTIRAVIYSKADKRSDTVAVLSYSDYILYPDGETVKAFLTTFGYDDYLGIPILSINHDSSWAKVSVQSEDFSLRKEGWVHLPDFREPVRVWATYLLNQPLVLRDDQNLRFYSHPNKNSQMNIRLFRFRNINEWSYILRPIHREGRWLLVELETPYDPCGGTPESIKQDFGVSQRKVRVWIQYLDEQMRPLVMPPIIC